ncbi:MAG: putative collagen-binding domain-containing protein [Bacteroidota bacterium]
MLSFDYFSRKPDQSFIAKNPHDPPGRLTGTSGEGYAMVYTPTGKKLWIDFSKLTFEIKTTTWFNPRNGEKQAATSQPVDGLLVFDPPGEEERGNDWVLILMV